MARYVGKDHGFYFTSRYKQVRDLGIGELEEPIVIKTKSDKPIIEINTKGKLIIYPGYSHDGCSPLIYAKSTEWWGIKIGAPDGIGNKLERPSRVHDALFQLFREGLLPEGFTLYDANRIFDEDMVKVGFLGRPLYKLAVDLITKLTCKFVAQGKPPGYILDNLWVKDIPGFLKALFIKAKEKGTAYKEQSKVLASEYSERAKVAAAESIAKTKAKTTKKSDTMTEDTNKSVKED